MSAPQPPVPTSVDEYLAWFAPYGNTDEPYARHHFGRFLATYREFDGSWDRTRGMRVLDLGAHWLHQAAIWQRGGYQVTAVDLPVTFGFESVQRLAESEGITLVVNTDLESCEGLAGLPDDGFDIVLMAEIIEHLTFNPVPLWRQIHRLLAPRGRIVVTTPNYYAWNGRAWDLGRFLRGFGGGITVDEIVNTRTYGHHWREFSRRELIRYFCLLSPDFNTVKATTMRDYYPPHHSRSRRALGRLFERVSGLRPNLHLEVELSEKRRGIVIEPGW